MPRRISMPSAFTSMVSATATEPSARNITSAMKPEISSRAAAGSARASARSATTAKRSSRRIVSSELDAGDRAIRLVLQLEILRLLETEGAGDEVGRHRFDHHVQIAHRAIVVATGH